MSRELSADWQQHIFCIKSKLYDSINYAKVSVLDKLILKKWIYFNPWIIRYIFQYDMMSIHKFFLQYLVNLLIKLFIYHYQIFI